MATRAAASRAAPARASAGGAMRQTPLAAQARRALRLAGRLAPSLAVLVGLALVATGRVRDLRFVGWAETLGTAALVAALVARMARRFQRTALKLPIGLFDDLELGGLLIGAAYLIVEVLGGALYPVAYLLMAFLVGFLPRRAGAATLAVALVFEAARDVVPHPHVWGEFLTHAAFLVLFAALYYLVLAAQVAKARVSEKAAIDRRLREIDERARAYRLVSSGSEEGAQDRERWVLASVREIEGAVGAAIEVAELALRTHTCAAFVLNSEDRLKLHDCRSTSEQIQRQAFAAGEGVLGGVVKRRAPLRLCGAIKGVTYYLSPPAVRSLLAVPIVEKGGTGAVRGVIIADRLTDEPFTENDEKLLSTVAGEVLRAIEIERVLTYIKGARDEKERLYKAIEKLNRTRVTAETVEVAVEEAQVLGQFEFVALTLAMQEGVKRHHRIAKVAGAASAKAAIEGLEFADNTGLVSNVVRYGAPLPGRDARQMDKLVVFDDDTQLKGLGALKILPLRAGDRVLGTLVVGTKRRGALDEDLVRTLEVLAMQVAQSILRANLFDQMERMATTDGLTGLLNHRTMQAKLDEAMQLANRYEKKLAFLLTDIDHFKSVNDTYGHPAGDLVLKGVAKILRRTARDTDVVARYGGEEFCVIMPETDAAGAKVMAERIRKEVEAAQFETELGSLKVTLSLGIATVPEAGRQKQMLIDRADQCLYVAKRSGRNRSVSSLEEGVRKAAAAG